MTTTDALALGMVGLGVIAHEADRDPEFFEKLYKPLSFLVLKQYGAQMSEELDPALAKLNLNTALNKLNEAFQAFEEFELENGDESWELKLTDSLL